MEWLHGSCYSVFDERISVLENMDIGDFSDRIEVLEEWKSSPHANAGSNLTTSVPDNLSTGLVLGLLTAVAPAMNSTNGRVNLIAQNLNATNARVNSIQSCLVSKGIMAA
jgi:hypothetical protein